MKAIQSDAVGNITTQGLAALHDLLIDAQRNRDVAERAVTEAAEILDVAERDAKEAREHHDNAEQRLARIEASWLRAFRKGGVAATKKKIEQSALVIADTTKRAQEARTAKDQAEQHRDELWVDTQFNLSGETHAAWRKVADTFAMLSRSDRAWDITAFRTKRAGEERSAVTQIIDRKPIILSLSESPVLSSEYHPLHWQNANGGDLFLYPGFLLVYQSDVNFALLDLNEVDLSFEAVRFNEAEAPPADAKRVGTAWTYSNRDGSPDRRFATNPQMPILLYAQLSWKSVTGLSEAFMFSNAEWAALFADAMAEFRASLRSLQTSNEQQPTEHNPYDQLRLSPALQKVTEDLLISIDPVQEQGTTTWQINSKLNCRKCGGSLLSVPDNHTDETLASCKACGVEIGRVSDIKAVIKILGENELRRRGLTPREG